MLMDAYPHMSFTTNLSFDNVNYFFLSPENVINHLCTVGGDSRKALQGLKNLAEVLTPLRDNARTKKILLFRSQIKNKMISFLKKYLIALNVNVLFLSLGSWCLNFVVGNTKTDKKNDTA